MKTMMNLLVCATLVLGATTVWAQPGGKGVPTFQTRKSLQTVEDFEAVKKDDHLGLVCLECHNISELTVQNAEDIQVFCKEGTEVTCPVCEKTYKTVFYGAPRRMPHRIRREVKYVNTEGKECAFITNLSRPADQEKDQVNGEDSDEK